MKRIRWMYFAAPPHFDALVTRLLPWLALLTLLGFAVGWYLSLYLVPEDYQQGNSYRILFIHVPAAWFSMFLYVLMALYAAIGWIWRIRTAEVLARAMAPTGALMTLLALWTGALWGRPTWGVYWVWDARLTSELILLFLYLGYLALHAAIEDRQKAANASALLAIVGVVNVPIIYFSVLWWNTLHQGPTVQVADGPTMAPVMVWALAVNVAACWAYVALAVLYRARRDLRRGQRVVDAGQIKRGVLKWANG